MAIKVSAETQEILQELGYDNAEDYIRDEANEAGVSYGIALTLFDILGESELFDGFVSELEELGGMDF